MSELPGMVRLSARLEDRFARRLEAAVASLLAEFPGISRITLWASSRTLSLLASSSALPEGSVPEGVEVFVAHSPAADDDYLRVQASAPGVDVPAVPVFHAPTLSDLQYEVYVRLRADGTHRTRALELAGELV